MCIYIYINVLYTGVTIPCATVQGQTSLWFLQVPGVSAAGAALLRGQTAAARGAAVPWDVAEAYDELPTGVIFDAFIFIICIISIRRKPLFGDVFASI